MRPLHNTLSANSNVFIIESSINDVTLLKEFCILILSIKKVLREFVDLELDNAVHEVNKDWRPIFFSPFLVRTVFVRQFCSTILFDNFAHFYVQQLWSKILFNNSVRQFCSTSSFSPFLVHRFSLTISNSIEKLNKSKRIQRAETHGKPVKWSDISMRKKIVEENRWTRKSENELVEQNCRTKLLNIETN